MWVRLVSSLLLLLCLRVLPTAAGEQDAATRTFAGAAAVYRRIPFRASGVLSTDPRLCLCAKRRFHLTSSLQKNKLLFS